MRSIVTALCRNQGRTKVLAWCGSYFEQRGAAFVDALLLCLDMHVPFEAAAANLGVVEEGDGKARTALLLCLRGLLGAGVLLHCLSLRHRVDYGIHLRCALLLSLVPGCTGAYSLLPAALLNPGDVMPLIHNHLTTRQPCPVPLHNLCCYSCLSYTPLVVPGQGTRGAAAWSWESASIACRRDAQTRMAVPYEACDLPSERSEYKHPDAAIAFTLLSYYQMGITEEQLREALRSLAGLEAGVRDSKFACAPPL